MLRTFPVCDMQVHRPAVQGERWTGGAGSVTRGVQGCVGIGRARGVVIETNSDILLDDASVCGLGWTETDGAVVPCFVGVCVVIVWGGLRRLGGVVNDDEISTCDG